MKQRTKRQTLVAKFSASALLLAVSLVCTSAGIQNWKVNAETATDGYTIVCDSDVFTTTENYAYSKSLTVDEGESGKKGMLVTANETGRAAEGSTFTLQETMTGNFEMDFRVFSEVAYTYGSSSGGWTHSLTANDGIASGYEDNNTSGAMANDNMNPFLDLKEVGIKFTSATDASKYFIVYVRGTCAVPDIVASATVASVYVSGDRYDLIGADRGYGIPYGSVKDDGSMTFTGAWYKNATTIRGTTFSNYMAKSSGDQTETATTSNLVKFDAENMKVYVNAGNGGNNFAKYNQTADVLVRDVSDNAYWASDSYTYGGMATLSAEDFANGYNVSVCYSDVTDNNCLGNKAFSSKISGPGQYGTLSETHDRVANMVIYSVNGKSVSATDLPGKTNVKPSDLISYNESELTVTDNKANSVFSGSGLNIRSVASGDSAENVGFDFNGYMLGEFNMTFGITSKVSYQQVNSANASTHYAKGTVLNMASDEFNPYADVQEVAIQFISSSNPEKFFTMYLRAGATSRAYNTTARVYVNGDKSEIGFGLMDGSSKGDNAFTQLRGTSFSNLGYGIGGVAPLPHKIRFDVENMKVYATSYEGASLGTETERLVRDLTDSSMITWYADDPVYYKTLSKEDFAQGYTVSVAFTGVTANTCVGSESALSQFGWTEGGYVTFDEAYDRYADMTIYSLNGQGFGYTGSKMTDSDAPIVAPTVTSIRVFESNDITPLYYDVVDGNVPAIGGKVSVSTDNVSYKEITATEGKYLFTADRLSKVYYVKYEGFADAQNNVLDSVVYELRSNAPFVKMQAGASIRIDTSGEGNDSGIRFLAYMTIEEYNLLMLNVNDLKFFYEISVEGGKTLEAEVPVDKIRITDTQVTLTAAVTGLSAEHYELVWTGKLYMTFTYQDGTGSGKIYADFNDNERTIKQVAQLALADTTVTYSEKQLAILNKYAGYTE